ncbi:hypothetical protein [Bacillus sp. OV322]|uniref:hypothetical protein n=1 Tax=Bacillus sp. OV322 TaxID=1882764 RepID=UPI000B86A14A|nr:hypothetical protein [Bacillus sp. OV322]
MPLKKPEADMPMRYSFIIILFKNGNLKESGHDKVEEDGSTMRFSMGIELMGYTERSQSSGIKTL